jgi:hypothetical protein
MRKLLHALTLPTLAICSGLFTGSLASAQTITTFAGGGSILLDKSGAPTNAQLNKPQGIATDSAGNVYFADDPGQGSGAVIYKVTVSTGAISIIAGTGAAGYTGDGGPATSATFSNLVYGICVAPSGNVYIADATYGVIRKITIPSGQSTGTISTFAGSNPTKATNFGGFKGDGGAATSAFLNFPVAVTSDGTNLWIADQNNRRVRVVNGNGVISTFAGNGTQGYTGDGGAATSAEMENPSGVAVDSVGNVYISDQGVSAQWTNSTVRKVTTAGVISTYAGEAGNGGWYGTGNGTAAKTNSLFGPHNIGIDSANNLYIADTEGMLVRKVDTSANIFNVAGNMSEGFTGDGGAATSAELNLPYAVAYDNKYGNIYIADTMNGRIRKVH